MGGLGNQMFQYAFGKALGNKTLYDLSWFDENAKKNMTTERFYELEGFNLNTQIATQREIAAIREKKQSRILNFIRRILNAPYYKLNEIHEPDYRYHKELLQNNNNETYYVGYFQCEKYFLQIREQLLKDFSLQVALNDKNTEMLARINSVNSISIHIRRGDYVNLQHIYELCNLDYYQNAIEYIALHESMPHFFLFSDEIDWVKQHLKVAYPVTYVDINDNKNGIFDIELMKQCKHNIIANSSFSWWGAWLNENPNKIVIAPKVWYSNGMPSDIVPDNWIKM